MSMFGVSKSALNTNFQAEQIGLQDFIQSAPTLGRRVQVTITGAAPRSTDTITVVDPYTVRYYNQGAFVATGAAAITREISSDIRITAAAGGGTGNAYILPWAPDHVCITELRSACALFVTATLNGCAIVIAGGRCNPTIAHLNHSTNFAGRNARYEAIAQVLENQGLDASNRIMIAPGAGYNGGNCAVFGVQGGDQRWTFYANDHGSGGATTRRIWPA